MTNQHGSIERLAARFEQLGARDPLTWARSEVDENIPQLARFCFLRSLWPDLIDSWIGDTDWVERVASTSDEPFADARRALSRMTDRGVSATEIATLARWVAYETVFGVLFHLADGMDAEAGDDDPGWALMETEGFGGPPTGRHVDALHEDLLIMDPSGREGRSEIAGG